jgi:hypothetical protein
MNNFFSKDFRRKELIGLEKLEYVLGLAYRDREVRQSIYESIIWSLARCENIAKAQSKLEAAISLIELYANLQDFTHEMETELNDFVAVIDEIIETELLYKALQDLRK